MIGQYSEFRAAVDRQAAYRKGLHTSFANVSIAIDDTMRAKSGYKVKRQDGKPITDAQKAEIARGIDEIESVLGPLKDLFAATDITIAHTSGKHPFLKANASGLYTIRERTVTIGTKSKLTGKPI